MISDPILTPFFKVFGFDQDEDAQDNFFTTSAAGFLKFYEKKQFIDCIVVNSSDNKEYHAHKLILAYSSQFFFDAFGQVKDTDPSDGIATKKSSNHSSSSDSKQQLVIGSRDERASPAPLSRCSSQEESSSDDENTSSQTYTTPVKSLKSKDSFSSTPDSIVGPSSTSSSSTNLKETVSSRNSVTRVILPWHDTEEILPAILHYMYTGRIGLSPQNCVLVSAVAERLQMPRLQNACKLYIAATLQRENAVELLLEASKYKTQNLLKRSISNVARNFVHLRTENISKLSVAMLSKVLAQNSLVVPEEYQLYRAVCDYCETHRHSLSKSNIAKLMGCIRFRWLSIDQFLEASSNPIVPKTLIIEATMARLMSHELTPEECAKKNATMPLHLQQRPKLKLLFEYTPPTTTTTSNATLSNQIGINNASSTASNQNSTSNQAPVSKLNNPDSSRADLAYVLAASSLSSSGNLNSASNASSSSSLTNAMTSSTSSPQLKSHPDIFTGVIGWISTNAYREAWRNPHVAGRVKVHSSSLAKGSRSTLVDKMPSEVWTNDIPSSWISIDLGPFRRLTLSYYTLRHGLNFKADALRTWDLQGSNDGISWKTLKRHTNDRSLNAPFVASSWPVQNCQDGYRFFRVLQTGHNSSNHNFLALSGFEFYGWLDITG